MAEATKPGQLDTFDVEALEAASGAVLSAQPPRRAELLPPLLPNVSSMVREPCPVASLPSRRYSYISVANATVPRCGGGAGSAEHR